MEITEAGSREIIINLLFSYSTKEKDSPSAFEIMAVEQALPFIKAELEASTYNSYMEWIQRHKEMML
ncbi:hypothetical protein D3P07_00560 [Paenibacillus sp. 1011MAR3C5]|uniref:hypothetical protein n=1 Tax=Paenibacillus sp. 1011MAR3C5 TaxID=1675787 RepID=UPI000E6C95F7|nr:hypothetical protein [Paenibacillus sp. 1011MAR3C5]RJE90635.1 hypothetical protein D3P07_00560 [Paenibacillus sp. 1011MAR3C5]